MHVLEHRGRREVLATRRERAHEDLLVRERVHANAVAEQRAAGAAPRRIHRDHRDLAIREVPHETRQQLVVEARLAGAAGAGDADDRRLVLRAPERAPDLLRGLAFAVRAFEHGDRRRDAPVIANVQRAELVARLARGSARASSRLRSSAPGPCAGRLRACRSSRRRTARALRSHRGAIVPPPPTTTRMCSQPCSFSMSTMYLKYSLWPPW